MRHKTKLMTTAPIDFADLDPQRRTVRLLEILLWVGVIFKVVVLVVSLMQNATVSPSLWGLILTGGIEAGCALLIRHGKNKIGVLLLVSMFFVMSAAYPLFFGRNFVFSMSSILLAVLAAGLILGMRAIALTTLSGLVLWITLVITQQNAMPLLPEFAPHDNETMVTLIWMMILLLMVIYAMLHQFYRLLEMQKSQADQLKVALTQLQASSVSNTYLDNILESISDILVVTTPQGIIERVNESVYVSLGYQRHEVIGQPIDFLLGDAARATSTAREIERTTKHGQPITLVVSCTPLPILYGQASGRVYVAHDITELKNMRNDLELSKMRYQSAVMASRGGVIEWDIRKHTIHANPTALEMLGISTSQHTFNADMMRQYIHPDDIEQVQREYEQAIAQRDEQYSSEYRLVHSDGNVIWVMVRGILRYASDGTPDSMVLIYIDMTDQKLAEKRALEVALEKEKLNLLTKFVNDASHHFRTSLTVILTSVWLLKRTQDPDKLRERVEFIEEHAITLNRLFDSLFKMFRIDMLNVLSLSPVRINELVQEVLERTETFALKNHIILETDLDDSNPIICADPDELGQALLNIVENAVIFSDEGGVVRVCTRKDEKNLYIDVIDGGIGIDPAEHTRIFERLYKSDPARSKGGLGLGLTMSRKLIELHHGEIFVDSQLGQGSTFTIRLPLHDSARDHCH